MDMNSIKKLIDELKLSVACYDILSFLVKTKEEFEEFIRLFWNESRKFFSVAEYRLYRIRKRNLTFKEFNDIFIISKKKAFEELFQQNITNEEINLFNENDEVDANYIFYEHKENPNIQFVRLVL